MSFWQQRMVTISVVGLGAVAIMATGLTFNGNFRAEVATERGLAGPLQLGVDGRVGHLADSEDQPVRTSTPFHGPTEEERALLLEARRMFAENWNREQRLNKSFDPDYVMVAPPEMFLPARHLTEYEKAQIRQAIRTWKQTR